jgi:hypothetical protein
MSVDRKVSPGYGFTAAPECKNCISAPPHLPVTLCKNTIFALLRKRFDLPNVTDLRNYGVPNLKVWQYFFESFQCPKLSVRDSGKSFPPEVNDIESLLIKSVYACVSKPDFLTFYELIKR